MMKWAGVYLQDSLNLPTAMLNNLMDWIMALTLSISTLVTWMTIVILKNKIISKNLYEHKTIETFWTFLPLSILTTMATFSLKTLYSEDTFSAAPLMTLKVTGHQWYWEYSYPDFDINFDSYMMNWESTSYRLTDVDNRIVLPMQVATRISVSSADVIHSWAIPSLAIKLDATPGRIISTTHTPLTPGLLFGTCAELCGVNHSFMPIVLEHTSTLLFKNWIHLKAIL